MMNYYNSLGSVIDTGPKRTWQNKLAFVLFFVMFSVLSVQGQNVTVSGALSGNGSYATLSAAFTAIGTSQSGATISVDIVGNTTETASAVLGNGSWASLAISPSGGAARTITGAITGNLIDFNGAKNVTVNGLNSGGNSLTISNTATGSSAAIRFTGDAANDTVTNTTILGSASTANFGVVMLGSGTTAGITGITLSNNTIGAAGSNFPVNAIYSAGASATFLNTATVTGNNISDYFNAGLATSGINVAGNNTGWTITNNKLFQSATRIYTSALTHTGIIITSGAGYTITGNIIGYANSSGTGTTNMVGNTVVLTGTFPSAYTTTGVANATRYIAISAAFTAAGATSSIQNNTIAGFALYTSSGATTTNGIFCGINVTSGNANIGTVTGNTIGGSSGNSSIYTACTTSGGAVVGIYATSANTVSIQNNTIGAIDASGTTATTSGSITAIDVAGAGNFTVSSNNIGNTSASNLRTGYFLSSTNLTNATGTATSTTGTSAIIGIRSAMTGNVLAVNSNIFRGWLVGGTNTTVTGIITSGTMTGTTPSTNINLNALGTSGLGWVNYQFANSGSLNGISCSNTVATVSNINTNDFRGITYTVAGTNSHTYVTFSNTSAGNVATIDGNTFTNLNINTTGGTTFFSHSYTIAATSQFTLNNNSIVTGFNKAAAGSVTISSTSASSVNGAIANYTNNNFSNITLTGSSTMSGFSSSDGTASGTSTKTITGNTFNNWSGTTGSITGMSIGYWSGTTASLSNNTLTNLTGQGSVSGISLGSSYNNATTINVANNTINNLTSTGTGSTVSGLSCANTSTTINITGNTIHTLSTTAGSAVTGLTVSGATTTNVFKNKIYNLSGSAAGSTVNGMLLSGGTNVNTYNNFIGDLKATAASGTDVIRGINITSATTISNQRLYYNTIYLNGTSSGANFGSTGVYHTYSATATTAALDMRNNIIVNASAANGTGLAVAFRRSASTDLNNYATTSNNNLFFGTSGVFNNGTNYATLANFQAITGARETNSKSQSPTFASTTGSDATYLHFASGATNLAGGNAQVISGYAVDYDGDTRDVSTPDIGADEFVQGTISAPSITGFTPSTICVAGGQSISITGTGLDTVTAVSFNGVAGSISAQTSTTLTAIAPPGVTDGTITVTNSGGTATSGSSYTAAPTPTVGVTSNLAICSGGAGATLIATGGSTYSWSPATGLSATTGDTVTANPSSTTTYTVTGTSAAGCPGTATVTVTVNQSPTAVSVGKSPATICANGVTTLTATGGNIPVGGVNATIGTATTLTTDNDIEPTAFNNRYENYWMQLVFTPAELNAAGITAGNITAVKFNITTLGSGSSVGRLMLRMGNAAAATLTGFQTTGLTLVRNSATYNHAVGVNTITFDTPYAWNGTSNVILDLRSFGLDSSLNAATYYTATAGNTVATAVTTSTYASPDDYVATAPTATLSVKRLNTTFVGTGLTQGLVTWSPTTDLYTTAAATTAYTGGNQAVVYSKGSATVAYTATVTNSGCTATGSATVSPFALPTITVDLPTASICNGGTGVLLTANGGTSYAWSPATGLSATTGASVTANPTTTTTYTITGTDGNGCVSTTTAVVTVNEPVVITSQPSNAAVAENEDATFTVTATGTGLTYQWQVNTGSGFSNISGANSASYTATAVTAGMSGYQYQVIVSGASPCASVTSTARTLTVSSVSISAQPTNQTICSTGSATFTFTATGATSYQWQVSTNSGASWTDLSGETAVSLVVAGVNSAQTGTLYRCLINGGSGSGGVDTDSASLTVYDAVSFLSQPSNQTICSNGASVTFSASALGSSVTYQWEVSTNGGGSWASISGANAASYSITSPALSLNGNQYRVVASGVSPCASVTSTAATLTINQLVAITAQPTAVNFCSTVSSTATFSVTATGAGLTYQWIANNGSDTTLADDANISGATTASLTVLNPSVYNGYTFKVIVSGTAPCAAVTSSTALLTITPLMGGTKTVGAGGDYATLTAAVAAYNAATCFSGNVVFNLTDATYSTSETFPITINSNANAGAYTLTVKPATTATITSANANGTLVLNGADNVIIDGSNNGTNSKDLTILSTNTTGSSASCVWVKSILSPLNGATNITIKNCILAGNSGSTTVGGIIVSGATFGGAADTGNNNLTITNNTISKAQNAIYAIGNATTPDTNWTVSNNTIGSTVTAEKGFRGIALQNVNGFTIANNTIVGCSTSSTSTASGILVGALSSNGTVSKNIIRDITNTNSGGYGANGIYLNSTSTTAAISVSNNFIGGVAGYGYASGTGAGDNGYGIIVNAGAGYSIYYNTVAMNVNQTISGLPAAFNVTSGVTTAGALNVRNNIFSNTQTTGTQRYAIYSGAANTVFAAIDYNNYYTTATNLGNIASTDRTNLAAIVTGFGGNANSKSVAPVFISGTDLHLSTGANGTINNAGTPIAGITTDYDGDTRSATTPDMGADEFETLTCASSALTAGTASSTVSAFCNTSAGATVSATGYTVGLGSTYQWQSSTDAFASVITDIGTAASTYASLSTGALSATISYRLKVVCDLGTPAYSNVITITKNTPAVTTVSPNVTICTAGSTTLTANGSSTYAWAPATGLSSTTGASVTANPTATTTYTVTGTDANGCTSTATVTVAVKEYPSTVTVTQGAASVCTGSVMSLTATGGNFNAATTGTVGSATSLTTADGTEPTAFNNRYENYWMQMVYTPAELNAAGIFAGSINAVKFEITTQGDATNVGRLMLRMGAATAATVTGFQTTGLTLVRNSATYNHVVGVNTIAFDTPYTWDGTSNVILDLRSFGADATYNAITYYTATTGNTVATAVTTGTYTSPDDYVATAPSATLSTKRLNTTFVGTAPTQGPITWSPTTDLYTDAGGSVAYTGQALATVYTKPTAERTYTATASNDICTTSGGTVVSPLALPVFTLADVTICGGSSTVLNAVSEEGNTYAWSPATGLSATSGASVTANPTVTTTYTVIATSVNNGCSKTQTVTVTVDSPPVVTSISPLTNNVAVGQDTSFTVTATGTGITYQWQVDPGTGFVDIEDDTTYSGSNSATLSINDPIAEMNAYQYQCIVSGTAACSTPAVSETASLSVDLTGITVQPTNPTIVCNGATAEFTTTAASVDPEQTITYLWEVKYIGDTLFTTLTDGPDATTGLTFSGTETGTLTTSATTLANSGLVFHCIVNGYIFSSNATLTVNPAVSISAQPADVTICNGASTSFSVTAANATSYQWEVSTNGGSSWSPISGANSATYSLTTPAPAANGNQYRVIIAGNASCAPTTSGVATLTITNPTVTNPSATSVIKSNAATFTVTAPLVTSYQWQYSTTVNGTYTNVVDNTPTGVIYSGADTATLSVLTATTTPAGSGYFYRNVVTYNGCTATSTGAQLTITDYCAPTYAAGPGTVDLIANVTLNELNNSSGPSTTPYYTFYGDVTIPDVARLSNANVSVTFGNDTTNYCAVWIDFNQNGIFEASEGVVSNTASGGTTIANGTSTVTLAIPSNAVLGHTRMRVRGGEDVALTTAMACGASSDADGEAEDYIVNITEAASCVGTPTAGTAAISSAIACNGATVSLSVTGSTSGVANITHQWSVSTDGTNFTPISGATSPTYTTTPLSAGTYTYHDTVTCTSVGGSSATTNDVSVTVYSPQITGTTPGSRCGTGTVTLGATASAGGSINWYAASSGGASLGTGTSFTTPSISATTTYYAEASEGGISENVGVPAPASSESTFITTGWGIVFNATSAFTLTSTVIYPAGTGTITVGLYNSSGTEIASTAAINVTGGGTLATPVTLPLGFSVPVGTGYRLLVKDYTGITGLLRGSTNVTYPYTSSSASVTSGWWSPETTTNYFFYNLSLTSGCQSPRVAAIATVTPKPTATISYASPICSTVTSAAVTLNGTNAYTGGTYSSTAGLTLNGSTGAIDASTSTPGTYTVTYTMNAIGDCGPQTATTSVTINQALTSSFTYAASTYCSNGGVVTPTVTGTSGVWTSSPSGLTLNGSTGAITLATSAQGTYTVTNTVSVAGCSNSVSTFSVTVNTAVAITSQPVSVSKLPTENTSFTVAATGTGLTYQWQVNTGSGFVNVSDDAVYSGSTSATLSLTSVDAGMNGYVYQVIVSGAAGCSSVTSTSATLTVSNASITGNPTNFTACNEGANTATFSITTSGTVSSIQWQTLVGATWTDLSNTGIYSGVDTATLTLTGVTLADNASSYRAVVNGVVNSNPATLTVNTAVAIGTSPSAATTCSGGASSFTVAATGTGLTYQWQVNTGSGFANITDGGVYTNATTATLNITGATIAMNGYQYQAVVSGASPCSSATSATATLTVNTAVAIGTQPANATICIGANNTFSVAATGTGLGYQWEENTGSGYVAISGANASSYTVTSATIAMNGYQYRVVVSGAAPCGSVTSNGATLTISQPAAPIVSPASSNICLNGIQALTVTNPISSQLTLGTGTSVTTASTTASTLGPNPFESYYGGARQQMLITAAELTTLGVINGNVINSVAFNMSAVETRTLQNYVVKMKNTSTAAFASTTFEPGAVTVKNAANVTPAAGWNTLTLDTPFTYTGQNLIVEVTFSNNDGGGSGTNTAIYGTTGFASTLFYRADNVSASTAASATTASFSAYSSRNNMRFNVLTGSNTWSPTTGLYTDAGATTPYSGGNALTVYAKPAITTTYTASNVTGLGCTNTSTTTVTVLPTPTFGSITQPVTTCAGSPTTFAVTGLLADSTSTLTYTINAGAPQTVANVVANGSGNASFTLSLAAFTNGQTLAITSVQRTDNAPSCAATITTGNTVVISVSPLVTYYADADGDTYGNNAVTSITCTGAPVGYVTNNTDCDDTDAAKHATFPFYADTDGDTYGAGSTVNVCAVDGATPPSAAYVTNNSDCNPTDGTKWQFATFYVDADADGYTVGTASVCSGLTAPTGYSATTAGTDCDDNDNLVTTGSTFYRDFDGDTFGDLATTTTACTLPVGYVTNSSDCNDADATKWQFATFFIDVDGDGFTAGTASVCSGTGAPAGYSATSAGTDCNDNVFSATNTCGGNTIVNLTLAIEGYYDTSVNGMRPVKNNQDFVSPMDEVEDLTIELYDATTITLVASTTATLHTDGTLEASFPSSPSGDYYVTVKGRNIIQTWSAAPVTVGTTAASYNFTSAQEQAYGSNMMEVSPGVWAFFSGDIDQNGNIDTGDYPAWEQDYNDFQSGVFATDIDGSGNVDTGDYPYWENNYNNFISTVGPTAP